MTGWRARAACRGTDPELFFPELGGNATAAKAVCAGCPVRAPCLAYAVSTPERHGVFGGLDERERRGMGLRAQPPQFRKAKSSSSPQPRKAVA